MSDLVAVDVAGLRGPCLIPEVRMRPLYWSRHVAINPGALHLELQHVAGSRYFYADDTIHDDHRYTAVLVGSLARPTLLLFDEESDTLRTMRQFAISGNTTGVDEEVTPRAIVRPNPARDVVEVIVGDPPEVEVIDLVDHLGRVVRSYNRSWTIRRLELNGLSAGAYTLVGRGAVGAVWRERMIIVR